MIGLTVLISPETLGWSSFFYRPVPPHNTNLNKSQSRRAIDMLWQECASRSRGGESYLLRDVGLEGSACAGTLAHQALIGWISHLRVGEDMGLALSVASLGSFPTMMWHS